MAAETVELATIWLVDLVGSTRLATPVGPVRADSLREEYFASVARRDRCVWGPRVQEHGRRLVRGVLVRVGGGVLRGADAAAVRASLPGAEQALHVRIGLGTGESTVKDGDYFGMPSIEAARLCDKAPADGILVSPATRMLAGRVEGARFESVGEIELKGIPEPMEAFAVEWEPLADEAGSAGRGVACPGGTAIGAAGAVCRPCGRTGTAGAFARAGAGGRPAGGASVRRARDREDPAGFVCGARREAEGFAVCWGACSEDLAAPYKPWIEVCSQLVEHAPREVLDGMWRRTAARSDG